MADDTKPTKEQKDNAIKAWHDAVNDDKKRAAVKEFPFLVDLYALASNFVTKEGE